MRIIQQYIDEKKGKRYYYSNQTIICDACETQLSDFVVVRACWSKKNSFIKQYCFRCSNKHVQTTEAEEKIVMSIVNKKPVGAKLVLIRPLELRSSNKDDSLFCNTLDTPFTNNKAKRSFHPSYTVLDDSSPALIGERVDDEVDEEKNRELDEIEAEKMLKNMLNEKILIGNDEEQKKIER